MKRATCATAEPRRHDQLVQRPVGRIAAGAAEITHEPQLLHEIEQLSQVLTDADSRAQLGVATAAVLAGQHYQILKALRSLLPREARHLAVVGVR
ncbi:flagellar biosynthesis repressor FlbT [Cereibacter azotoformans]|uniref:Uncharacterized protein n=1 Tax=Cereibacter sphaeroides (strain ATCC 17025 / ATH 2.4.3) TaxID=349102 RepID=A4WZW9_CERS5